MHGKLPDSTTGMNLIQERLTGSQRSTEFVIVRSEDLTVGRPAFRAYVAGLASRINALGPGVVGTVTTYYQADDPSLVSKNGRETLVRVVMAGSVDHAMKNVDKLHELVVAGGGPGFTLAQTGDASINQMITKLAASDLERAEIFGMPAALIVLVSSSAPCSRPACRSCSASSASSSRWRWPVSSVRSTR